MSFKLFLIFLLVQILLLNSNDKLVVHLAGDSTMAVKKEDRRPETGWGEKLTLFFNDNVSIKNYAKNGRSTKSFIDEGIWDSLLNSVNEGDYVFVQFAHNDEKKDDTSRYASVDKYKENLIRFIQDTRAKEATPVLLTPVVRRRFDENGKFYGTHGKYPDAVKEVSKKYKVALLDMTKMSRKLLIKQGEEKSKKLFLILEKGEFKNYPNGINDNTHFSDGGAKIIASLAAKLIESSDLKLKKYLVNTPF